LWCGRSAGLSPLRCLARVINFVLTYDFIRVRLGASLMDFVFLFVTFDESALDWAELNGVAQFRGELLTLGSHALFDATDTRIS
jgi:hypothetical protein